MDPSDLSLPVGLRIIDVMSLGESKAMFSKMKDSLSLDFVLKDKIDKEEIERRALEALGILGYQNTIQLCRRSVNEGVLSDIFWTADEVPRVVSFKESDAVRPKIKKINKDDADADDSEDDDDQGDDDDEKDQGDADDDDRPPDDSEDDDASSSSTSSGPGSSSSSSGSSDPPAKRGKGKKPGKGKKQSSSGSSSSSPAPAKNRGKGKKQLLWFILSLTDVRFFKGRRDAPTEGKAVGGRVASGEFEENLNTGLRDMYGQNQATSKTPRCVT